MKFMKGTFLLPTTYNDGRGVPPEVVNSILGDIYEAFDGYTVEGLCDGAYRMGDGSRANDKSLKVWVVFDRVRVGELKKLLARFARVLEQECLYFEVAEAEIEFIPPEDIEEQDES